MKTGVAPSAALTYNAAASSPHKTGAVRMSRFPAAIVTRLLVLSAGLIAAGCVTTFSQRDAREVSRERLLELSEAGRSDHILYMGSDFYYHYAYDSRPDKARSYKVRADGMKLRDTFPVGEDSYVLHPWVIEGKPFGSKTAEAVTNEPPAADDH
jgi:hypothetical protein